MNVLRSFGKFSLAASHVYGSQMRSYCKNVTPTQLKWWQKIMYYKNRPRVAIIPVRGNIMHPSNNVQSGKYVNITNMRSLLKRAEKVRNLKAIALEISSPGGSPVQSDVIRNEILIAAGKLQVPVYAFVEDMAASGGYYVACAAKKIFVNRHSVIGSIGVLYASFGLNRFIARYDIDRRVLTAGKNKMALDPFQEESQEGRSKMEVLLRSIHEEFIEVVRASRQSRLREDLEPLFEGDIWTAKRALELGLVDDLYESTEKTLYDIYGPLTVFQRFQVQTSLRDRLAVLSEWSAPSISEDERALNYLAEFFGHSAMKSRSKI